MSTSEILAELPRLSPNELAAIQARIDELVADTWQDGGELSEADKRALDSALREYEKSPDAGSRWEEVKARIEAKLGQ